MDFYSNIHDWYHAIFPLNHQQVSWVKTEISDQKAEILEIGCATGSLAFALHAAGYSVKAIDLDESMVAFARQKQGNFNPNLTFIQADMLNIVNEFGKSKFDAVTCFGNTIVHLSNLNQIEHFFASAHTVLKPGGKFLFQILNYDMILRERPKSLPLIENEQIRFSRNYHYRTDGYIDFNTNLYIKSINKEIDSTVVLFPIAANQVSEALSKADFRAIELFGSFATEPLTPNSFPLVVKAVKT